MSDPLPACPGGQAAPRLEPRGRPTEFANYWHSVGVAVGDSPKAPHYASQKPPPDEEWCPWNNPNRDITCPPTGTSPVRGQGDVLSAIREIPVIIYRLPPVRRRSGPHTIVRRVKGQFGVGSMVLQMATDAPHIH